MQVWQLGPALFSLRGGLGEHWGPVRGQPCSRRAPAFKKKKKEEVEGEGRSPDVRKKLPNSYLGGVWGTAGSLYTALPC